MSKIRFSFLYLSAVFCESWQGIEAKENEAVALAVNKLKHFFYIVSLRFFPHILISPNPKCRLFLKLTSKGTWRQVFICLSPPPLLVICLGL
jgi:hypothetical protein